MGEEDGVSRRLYLLLETTRKTETQDRLRATALLDNETSGGSQ